MISGWPEYRLRSRLLDCDDGRVDYVEVLVKLGRVTAEQWGLVTTAQARQADVSL